ncbi:hypothetical protein E2562_024168, partial [Oryza meyeriana var. granulata]
RRHHCGHVDLRTPILSLGDHHALQGLVSLRLLVDLHALRWQWRQPHNVELSKEIKMRAAATATSTSVPPSLPSATAACTSSGRCAVRLIHELQ